MPHGAGWRQRVAARGLPTIPSLAAAWPLLLPLLAVLVALVPRGALLWRADFPLNDGGLFAVMIDELVAARFVPPAETAYNHAGLPWAYPPLPFYIAGAAAAVTGLATTTLLLWLPLLLNLGSVAAFCWLATALIPGRPGQLAAAAAFAIMPFSFHWQLMGAGLTRAAGLLFALLALAAACRFLDGWRVRDAVLTAAFAAAAILSHPEATMLCGVLLAVLWLTRARDRASLRAGLAIAVGIVTLAAPWWVTVLLRHGAEPFVAASRSVAWSPGELAPLLLLSFTSDGYATPLAVLAAVGAFFELSRRRPLLPLWLLAAFAVPRLGFRAATVPAALLVGITLGQVVVPSLLGDRTPGHRSRLPRLAAFLLPVFLLGHALVFVTLDAAASARANPPLTAGERAAMSWAGANLPADARVLVVSSAPSWAEDPVSEWFPALTQRTSVVTPQGCEWLPGDDYPRRVRAWESLVPCRDEGLTCLVAWLDGNRVAVSHVFVSKVPRGRLAPVRLVADLAASHRFDRVWEGPAAVVFARR